MLIRSALASLLLLSLSPRSHAQHAETVTMNRVKLSFTLDTQGSPVYEVSFDGKPVILPSHLGFALNEDSVFYKGFRQTGVERRSFDETWQPVWGETKDIRNHYEELVVHLQKGGAQGGSVAANAGAPGRLLDIVF